MDYELQCPNCKCELEIDDNGDLALLELPKLEEGETRGLGGLKVEHINFDSKEQYRWNSQAEPQVKGAPVSSLQPIAGIRYVVVPESVAPVSKEQPTDADQVSTTKVMEANKKDLNKRNLK